ncbi:unnamed protein product [Effrenium voratum]|uniref:Uncharacterized protein n=1 Tax=Effrenium voratum TaxID=2562239 RepID=A0AA36MXV2_9DINO|nr:unnamed protein product [Effrenium voratum]
MAMMRTRTKSRGMCLCLLGIALALLVQPSTDFARGVPGLKEHAKRHPLHAGVARRAGAAQEDNSGQDRLDLEEVVAEAKRVVDNGTLKDMQVVMRKVQLTDPGKWNDLATKPELKQQLKKFVAEAALKALEEDLLLARQQQASAQRQVETAQRQVESAQRQVESAQRQVESAQEQEAMAVRRLARAATVLETAEDSGNATKVQEAKEEVKEAKEEVKEAKEEVKEAKEEVEKAERKVEKAERKVERAKKEVQAAKASGRTKESEADGQQAAIEAILSSSWTVRRSDCTWISMEVLLQSAGMRRDDAEWCSAVLPWKKVMRALQQKLGLSKELLVVGVDEVMQLEQKCGTKPCCNFISTLMNTQDASLISGEFPVIFIWTALFESYMKERASQSGRKIATLISLKALPPDSLDRVPQEIRNAFEQTPGRRQLLRQLLGHPRLTFDALQDAFSVCGVPETTFALAQFRMIMISFAKLDQGKSLQSDEVRQWYSPSAIIATGVQDDLVSRGLVQAVQFGNSGHKSVLHPLILQSWAESHREPLANQIKKMFEEDAVIEAAHEKKFETVMLHFDAAVRLALEQESCTLEQLFPGASLKPESLREVLVLSGLRHRQNSVVELDSFDDVDEVMSSLQYGSIVVSQKRTEKGIEYLVPWTVPRKDHRQLLRSLQPTGPGEKDPNAHLLILGVQTKYVQEFVGKWPSVEDKAKKALAGLQANPKVLQALPVFYTTESTKEGRSLDNPNVYFNEVGLAELLLERTGPLRLFFEKRGKPLQNKLAGFG